MSKETNEVKTEVSEEIKTAIANYIEEVQHPKWKKTLEEAVANAQYPVWKKAVWFVAGSILGGVGTYVGMKNM